MSLDPWPFFPIALGLASTTVPLATSPVAKYKAPDAQSSWTALGIHGYVEKYNEQLTKINDAVINANGAFSKLNKLSPTEYMYSIVKDTLDSLRFSGVNACTEYNNHLAWSLNNLVAGCQQLGVSLPRHGKTVGMKPVYAFGMVIPDGAYTISE
jgi:hypothetical protein